MDILERLRRAAENGCADSLLKLAERKDPRTVGTIFRLLESINMQMETESRICDLIYDVIGKNRYNSREEWLRDLECNDKDLQISAALSTADYGDFISIAEQGEAVFFGRDSEAIKDRVFYILSNNIRLSNQSISGGRLKEWVTHTLCLYFPEKAAPTIIEMLKECTNNPKSFFDAIIERNDSLSRRKMLLRNLLHLLEKNWVAVRTIDKEHVRILLNTVKSLRHYRKSNLFLDQSEYRIVHGFVRRIIHAIKNSPKPRISRTTPKVVSIGVNRFSDFLFTGYLGGVKDEEVCLSKKILEAFFCKHYTFSSHEVMQQYVSEVIITLKKQKILHGDGNKMYVRFAAVKDHVYRDKPTAVLMGAIFGK
jgi:hypothetical protein